MKKNWYAVRTYHDGRFVETEHSSKRDAFTVARAVGGKVYKMVDLPYAQSTGYLFLRNERVKVPAWKP